jgi:hypothetical protein
VSTLEVAAVLGKAYGVADVCVGAEGGDADDQDLVAEYVPAGAWITAAALTAYAKQNLAPYEVPVTFQPRAHLHRGALGKTQHPPRYRLTSRTALDEALRAYRRSEVIFALAGLGALPLLAAGASAADLANALNLDPEVTADLIAAAHDLGLLTVAGPADPAVAGPPGPDQANGPASPDSWADLPAAAAAERAVRDSINRRDLIAAARAGMPLPASAAGPDGWPARVTQVRELAGVQQGDTLLQIGSGPPRYAGAGPLDPDPPEARCDVCFVVGAVHGPGPAQDLIWLTSRLRPGGRLVIEDRYLDSPHPTDATLRLSWLARGARRWWHLSDLQAGLESIGSQVSSVTTLADPPAAVLIAHWSERCG